MCSSQAPQASAELQFSLTILGLLCFEKYCDKTALKKGIGLKLLPFLIYLEKINCFRSGSSRYCTLVLLDTGLILANAYDRVLTYQEKKKKIYCAVTVYQNTEGVESTGYVLQVL